MRLSAAGGGGLAGLMLVAAVLAAAALALASASSGHLRTTSARAARALDDEPSLVIDNAEDGGAVVSPSPQEEEDAEEETAVIESLEATAEAADDAQQEQEDKGVSCMEWIPTDPSTPSSAYGHCYDGTHSYDLTPSSRPLRCSPQYFNLDAYNYQQILNSNSDGATLDEYTVCVEWFNTYAGLKTSYGDFALELYPLNKIGNGGTYDLPACTGDCDSDAECQPGLFCLQRNLNSPDTVAFCDGKADERVDYCIPERYRDGSDWAENDYLEDLEESIKETVMGEDMGEGVGDEDGDGDENNFDLTLKEPQEQEDQDQDTMAPDGGTDSEDADEEELPEDFTENDGDEQDGSPGPIAQNGMDKDKEEDTSEGQTLDGPADRTKSIPIEVPLPSFFMAIDVAASSRRRLRALQQQQKEQQDDFSSSEGPAVSVIDKVALRIAVQNAIADSIGAIDDRLWGVPLQVKNVDTITVSKDITREFFAFNNVEAIFLVPETTDKSAAADSTMTLPLPEDEQLREAMVIALQKEPLMSEFAEAKKQSALPRATNVGVSFMDGTPISGSTNFVGDEQPVDSASASTSTSEQVSAFFSPLTIGIVAGVGGALILLIGGISMYSRRRATSGKKEDDLTPRSRSFPDKTKSNSKFTFDDDPDPMQHTLSNDTHPISPMSSAAEKDEQKKQQMNHYFEKIKDVQSQAPSVEESLDYDASLYDESLCGMSTWSVNDIGKDHVQLTDKDTLKPDKSIASVGKRMRQALGQPSAYAESEADVSYADTDNTSTLGDFRLGSVLGVDDTNMSEHDGTMGGITEEVSGEYTPEKRYKNSDFSALWVTRLEAEECDPAAVDASPAKSIEDEVLGVSLSETNAAMKRLKKENKIMKESNFLDVSHHAPRFGVGEDESDSEADDEVLLFNGGAPTTIQEQDELNTSVVSSSSNGASEVGSSPSSAKTGAGSIIGSILGKDEEQDQLDYSVAYLDNTMVDNLITNDTKGSGDKIIDDDVSDAESSVDMLESVADDILHGQDTNLLSEVASSNGTEEEPKFFHLDMPAAYLQKDGNDKGEGSVNESEYDQSLYEM